MVPFLREMAAAASARASEPGEAVKPVDENTPCLVHDLVEVYFAAGGNRRGACRTGGARRAGGSEYTGPLYKMAMEVLRQVHGTVMNPSNVGKIVQRMVKQGI